VVRKRKRGRLRAAWNSFRQFVEETVGEMLFEKVSCLLLAGVAAGAYVGWQRSPALTMGALVVLLLGAVAAITAWRHPGPLRARRMGATLVGVFVGPALWFVMYGSNCGCL
jgi:hypothetical protein